MKTSYSEHYTIDDSIERIDFEQVRNMLKSAFWSKGIRIEEIKKGASNSALVVAAYGADHSIVGYLRVISDKTRFAYILDVYVDEPHRGRGIARAMVRFAQNHPELGDVYQWLLITRDAHEVYRGVGFQPLPEPDKWMCILNKRPDR